MNLLSAAEVELSEKERKELFDTLWEDGYFGGALSDYRYFSFGRNEMNLKQLVLVDDDNAVVAYGNLKFQQRETDFEFKNFKSEQKMNTITYWTNKDYRGNGYGSDLVSAMIDEKDNPYPLLAIIKIDNISSQALVEKLGFDQIDISIDGEYYLYKLKE